MTARLMILYGHPEDAAAFEQYYASTHIPYASEHMPNVREATNSRVLDTLDDPPDGRVPFYRISQLTYDDLASLRQGIESEDGRSTIADLATFATGGATLLIIDDD